jgi:uncharacterized membrane protein YvbJ
MGSNTKNCEKCGMPNWAEATKCAECGNNFTGKKSLKDALGTAIASIIFHEAVIAPQINGKSPSQDIVPPITKEELLKKKVIKEV